MSSIYRKISIKMWDSQDFKDLSPIPPCGQGLWVYLLTNPDTVMIPGLYRAGKAQMAEVLGWTIKEFEKGFAEPFAKGMAKADWIARVVWVPKAIIYNPPDNPNVVKGWAKHWELIPDCPLKQEAYESLKSSCEALGEGYLEAFVKGCPKGIANPSERVAENRKQDQDQDQDQDQGSGIERLGQFVYDYYSEAITRYNQNRNGKPELTGTRKYRNEQKRRVEARLNDGYIVEDLKAAIDGCLLTPHNIGTKKDGDGTTWTDLELICRDGKHVDTFIKHSRSPPQTSKPGRTREEQIKSGYAPAVVREGTSGKIDVSNM
ncbi:MAG: hypothetical protein GY923_15365 [Aestuariibacter sp.]|nr:hypothetical protein [Aestuariibacter sp.]